MTVPKWCALNLSNMMKTFEIDATGQAVGRVATQVAKMLLGKTDPTYTPNLDPNTQVTIKNASKVKFTGRKLEQKDYKHHTLHPGGLKTVAMKTVFRKDPTEVMRKAVYGMMTKNRRRDELMQRLTIVA